MKERAIYLLPFLIFGKEPDSSGIFKPGFVVFDVRKNPHHEIRHLLN